MATHYLYGTVLTGEAVAANNRGDTLGNTTTLQKIFHQDDLHTSVSAEAIRFALRYRFQLQNQEKVNRTYDASIGKLDHRDEKRVYWAAVLKGEEEPKIDDDLMGFMDAAAAKQEAEEEPVPEPQAGADRPQDELVTDEHPESKKSSRKPRPKGKTTRRASPLAVGRAVSLRPYRGEISFNAVSGQKEKGKLSLYSAEMHTTEYQYSFGLNLNDILVKEHITDFLEAVIDPPPVAGNHARFAYDFSPASIVLRLTNGHSSKIQNCFEHDESSRTFTVERLIHRVESGDIPAMELIIAGEMSKTPEGLRLKELQVPTFFGVKAAADETRRRIANECGAEYTVVAPKKE
jgi:CRISPR-associated protein Cst2